MSCATNNERYLETANRNADAPQHALRNNGMTEKTKSADAVARIVSYCALFLLLCCVQNTFGQTKRVDENGANPNGLYRDNSYGRNAQRDSSGTGDFDPAHPWEDRALPDPLLDPPPTLTYPLYWHGDFSGTLVGDGTGTLRILHSLDSGSNDVNNDGNVVNGADISGLGYLDVEKAISGGTLSDIGVIRADTITGGTITGVGEINVEKAISGGIIIGGVADLTTNTFDGDSIIHVDNGGINGGTLQGNIITDANIGGNTIVDVHKLVFEDGSGNYRINTTGTFKVLNILKASGNLTVSQTNVELGVRTEIDGTLTVRDGAVLAGYDKDISYLEVGGSVDIDNGTVRNINEFIVDGTLTNGEDGLIEKVNLLHAGAVVNSGSMKEIGLLVTDRNLTNSGEYAVIDGGDTYKHMEVGGNLINEDDAQILNYGAIEVDGNLRNDSATIKSDHHWVHNDDPDHPSQDYAVGVISVGGNVTNTNSGKIDTFDLFNIDGNLTNNANSSITAGHLATLSNGEMRLGNAGQSALVVGGTATNRGTINAVDVVSIKTLDNVSGTIDDVYVLSAETITNGGTISNIGDHIGVTGDFTNNANGMVDEVEKLNVGGKLTNSGTIQETKKINVTGDLANNSGGVINNVQDYIDVGGNMTNNGTVTNTGLLKVDGSLNNTGRIGDTNVGYHGSVSNVVVGSGLTNTGTINTSALNVTGNVSGNGKIYADSIDINGTFTIGGTIMASSIYASKSITIDTDVTGSFRDMTTDADLIVNLGRTFYVDSGSSVRSGNNVDNSGLIFVDGTLTARKIANKSLAMLGGNGVINGNVTNEQGGVISPGIPGLLPDGTMVSQIGSLTIKGGLINDGGTLAIGIGGTYIDTDRYIDFIRVTGGKAQINGGTLEVMAATGSQWKKGTRYYFLDTDNVGDLDVTAPLALQVSTALASDINIGVMSVRPEHDEKSYWLEIARAYDYGTGDFTNGMTINQRNVGTYLDKIGSEPAFESELWKFLERLDKNRSDNGDAAARYALDELSGAIYGTLGTVSIHNTGIVNTTIADTLRSDVFKFSYIGNPNNAIRGQTIAPLRYNRWATGYGIGGNSKNDGNASGYKQSFGGGIAGFDRAFWTGSRVGAYISGADGQVTMKQLSENSRSREFLVGLYLRQEMYYGYGIASFGFGQNMYKTTRNIAFLGETATNRHHGDVGTAYFERGIDLPWRYGTVQPYTSFQIAAVRQKDFTENGAGVANLESVTAKTDSFRFAFGTRTSTCPIPLSFGQIALSSNLTWFHEFATDNDRDFFARLDTMGGTPETAATFRVWGNDPKQDWINLGWGGHFDRNSTRVFVGGNVYANDRQVLYTGNGGFITSW